MPYQQISHIAIVLANSELVNLQRVHWIFLYRDAAAGDGEGVFLKHITLRAVAANQTSLHVQDTQPYRFITAAASEQAAGCCSLSGGGNLTITPP